MKPPGFLIRRALALVSAAAVLFAAGTQVLPQPASDPATDIVKLAGTIRPVVAKNGMVTSQNAIATRIGVEILEKGGNAVDAAVAVGFALAVTHPRAGNLGGGGFFVIWLAEKQQAVALDFREAAPALIDAKSFLDENGKPDMAKVQRTGLGVGVPGSVSGLATALEKYSSGKFTLAELIAPAIKLAREGVPVESDLAASLNRFQGTLLRWPSSAKIFAKDGKILQSGLLVQGDLANTLETIAKNGPHAFYRGEIASMIARAVREAGGVMTVEDLAKYKTEILEVVRGSYRGYDVLSMPPPSSGGALLVQLLNILEGYELKDGPNAPRTLHLMVEAMKRAYADRAEFFGDPAFVNVPLDRLTSKEYAARIRDSIKQGYATPSSQIRAGVTPKKEGENTTHFSILDKDGNAVAATVTLNLNFGLGLVAEGTGVLLNNELDDFALAPGVPNAFGLIGGAANAPGPGKKPLSSMSPTILLKDGKVFLVTGTPGGSTIITTVLRVVSGVIDHKLDIAQAVLLPRIHHQWMPDEVRAERVIERVMPPEQWIAFETYGHKVNFFNFNIGAANSILVTPEGITGVSDPRYLGTLAAGH
ncbi:MAG: gamma-glutamyltransferase [Xanthobacteraceae bacterium]|nr:gamma-glutamyltransferase [Xanthobacteraceae bacterium]